MEKIDCAVIGAGVIGLAVARRLAAQGREVVVLEAEGSFGTGISARNSEVIHAGIYYPADSLKARLCVAGRRLLYAYCEERGIAHRRCGKLIVANSDGQREELARIAAAARTNGVDDLQLLSREAARSLEPALECSAALLSPSTGIIDSHALMLSLLGDAEGKGAVLAVSSPVLGGEPDDAGIVLDIGDASGTRLHAGVVVNCAGLGAQQVSRRLRGLPAVSSVVRDGDHIVALGREDGLVVEVVNALGGRGFHFRDFRVEQPTLEEVFLALTGRALRDQ